MIVLKIGAAPEAAPVAIAAPVAVPIAAPIPAPVAVPIAVPKPGPISPVKPTYNYTLYPSNPLYCRFAMCTQINCSPGFRAVYTGCCISHCIPDMYYYYPKYY